MTQITLNQLDRYITTNTANMTDKSVLQLDGKGSFKISDTDKRYALFRSNDDKNNNLATRQAVFSALKNAGLDMNNLSSAMKDAMKINDFSLDTNGKVTSDKPLSDRRLRAIVAQAKIELAGKAWTDSAENKERLSNINVYGGNSDPVLVGIHMKDALSYTTPDKARAELFKVFTQSVGELSDDVFFKSRHNYLDRISKSFDDLFSANKIPGVGDKYSLKEKLAQHYTTRAEKMISAFFDDATKFSVGKADVLKPWLKMEMRMFIALEPAQQREVAENLMEKIKESGKFTENEINSIANLMRTLTGDEV